jgi:dihydrodipicolinate synthase/N-acetylneuraminate lyase
MARLVGIVAGGGAGSTIHHMLGDGLNGWYGVAALLVGAFIAMFYSEYQRESGRE